MQDERPVVDFSKHDGPRRDEFLGAPRKDGGIPFRKVSAVAAILIAVLVAFLVFGRDRPVPPPASKTVRAAPPDAKRRATAPAKHEAPAETVTASEVVDPLETARDKICRSIASEFVEMPSPTQEQMRRTLIVYGLNECSSRYIRDRDAEGRGLDSAELKAIQEQQDVGPLVPEDSQGRFH